MAYRRYGKRSYKKRYYKRKRTFSRYNTYRHRSSKAQAYQIYKLNKKVNHVYKMTKPELQIYTDDINNSGTPHIDIDLTTSDTNGYKSACLPIINRGNGCFNGHYARIKDVTITASLEYMGNPLEGAQTQTCGLRLIFFRTRADMVENPNRTDILKILNDKPNNYYLNCPLEQGFSTRYKLVKDFRTVLTPQSSPAKSYKIHFKYPYSLLAKTSLDVSSQSRCKNSLWCVYYICRAGTYAGSSVDTFQFSGYLKFAYTDDNYNPQDGNNKNIELIEDNDESVEEPEDKK